MSQLAKAVKYKDTGNKIFEGRYSPLFEEICSIESDLYETKENDVCTIYSIGVKLEASVAVSDLERMKNPFALEKAISNTKRSIVEAVFGEFRENFCLINKALYERDFAKASALLNTMQVKMFEDI